MKKKLSKRLLAYFFIVPAIFHSVPVLVYPVYLLAGLISLLALFIWRYQFPSDFYYGVMIVGVIYAFFWMREMAEDFYKNNEKLDKLDKKVYNTTAICGCIVWVIVGVSEIL